MNQEQVALKALEAYSLNAPVITFLRHNENVTFLEDTPLLFGGAF